ncbi:hypothetical protein [Actinoalloteichus caeruleus]|uniref:Uncharacterized protein n=1 Tax=Actinoalloteichus caeruleus DSM 43889 TaxID=1120930 RepID=A0ABT1JKR7_ACTCY|nr:hypothetical protein [Actinoalloteichus caeruleus]MCP2332927.1 hypothetical protein [Actinoalloteichus caeruleus DSM 43889]
MIVPEAVVNGQSRLPWSAWNVWSAWRARRTARALDRIVRGQLPLVRRLDQPGAHRTADYLAEIVLLAQAYRNFADGWIDRTELDRRGRRCLARIEALREEVGPPPLTSWTRLGPLV